MKASQVIAVLARCIERFGDKPIIINTGDEIFREPTIDMPGLFYYRGKVPRNSKDKPYMYFDVDLT